MGDSYDNGMAESVNGFCKTELIRRRGPWKGLDDVVFSTLEYVDWFNHPLPSRRDAHPLANLHLQQSTKPPTIVKPSQPTRP